MKKPKSPVPREPGADGEEPPPLLGTWNRLYAAVAVYTGLLIAGLYFLTVKLNR